MTNRFASATLVLALLWPLPAQAEKTPFKGSDLVLLRGPAQVSAYRAIGAYLPVRVVKRGPKVRPLPASARQLRPAVTWKGETYRSPHSLLTAARLSGVLVLKVGRIAYEGYALGRRKDDRWISFSVAKSVTAILIGAAIQDGTIGSIDDTVDHYLPEMKGSAYEGVTIRQLLTMTSGVRWSENYADPASDVSRLRDWPGEPGMPVVVSYMRRLPREAPAGRKFVYKTGETDLAGALLARATGRSLADYLSEKIWKPYGMEADATWVVSADGMERGGSSLSMTLRDYARLGLFLSGGGLIDGKSVLPPGYLADATSRQNAPDDPKGYGYFWWVGPDGSFSAQGIFGQLVRISPKDNMIMVANGAWASATDSDGVAAWDALFEGFRRAAKR